MTKYWLALGCFMGAIAVSPPANAQGGVPGGIAYGAHRGWDAAGPVGAVVGGAVGGAVGGVEGILGIPYRDPYAPSYVTERELYYRHGVHHRAMRRHAGNHFHRHHDQG